MNEYISWPLQSGIIIINREELMILIDRKAEHSPTITTGLEIAYLKQSMSIRIGALGHTLYQAHRQTLNLIFLNRPVVLIAYVEEQLSQNEPR